MKWFHAVAFVGLLIATQFTFGLQVQQESYDLGAAYRTHVSTDKPIYRTGEKLYVRGVVLRAEGHAPMTFPANAWFQINGPKGDIVASGTSAITDSVVGFSWDIPDGQAGGEYTVRSESSLSPMLQPSGSSTSAPTVAPRLKSQIVFVRDGYGPGDTVAASLHVERAEGGIPAGAKVSVSARVDGEETWRGETKVDGAGNAAASFKLPAAIARGEGVLAMVIQDGGAVETAAKTIPILLQTIDVAIYPEGGDLIAGLTNRVYIEGRTPTQKPADMAGVIVNAAGKEVADIPHRTRRPRAILVCSGERRNVFAPHFRACGNQKNFPTAGCQGHPVLSYPRFQTSRRDSRTLLFASPPQRAAPTALPCRSAARNSHSSVWLLAANQTSDITVSVPRSIDGVIAATVYDERNTPLAERLLFRQPARQLQRAGLPRTGGLCSRRQS